MIQKTICLFVCLCLFRATPLAYGSSQARGQVGAAAASLCHSHSNAESKQVCNLHHISQQCWILNPLSKNRDRTRVLMDTSWVHYPWAMMGTPNLEHFTFTLSYGPLPANLWAGNFHLHFIDESIIYFYVPICSEPSSDSDIFLVS